MYSIDLNSCKLTLRMWLDESTAIISICKHVVVRRWKMCKPLSLYDHLHMPVKLFT